ncbi:Uncharacterised protein [BD1-7 clade bacterium]|nr:Uncharacterised protein [BD1-7 clade bacterium]
MNRRKKINQILKKKAKKANAKINPVNKPKYISKAERAQVESADTPTAETETLVDNA